MKLMVDNRKFKNKMEAENNNKTLTNFFREPNKLKNINVEELIQYVKNGQTVICGELDTTPNNEPNDEGKIIQYKRNGDYWLSQQIFMIDIDNKTDILTLNDMLKICNENNIKPAFVYETLSSSQFLKKYRVVFVADRVIYNPDDVVKIYLSLFNMFKVADERCKDLARMFYGSNGNIVYKSINDTVDIGFLLDYFDNKGLENILQQSGSKEVKGDTNSKYNTSYWTPFLPENREKMTFNSYSEIVYHLTHNVDIKEFLGVNGKSFKCIMPDHDDKKPSAGVFKTKKGEQYYNCFACGVKGNIIMMVQKLKGLNRREAIEFLMEYYNMVIEESKQVKNLKINQTYFEPGNDEIETYYNDLYKVIYRYYEQLIHIHDYGINNAKHGLLDENEDLMFFASKNYFSKVMNKTPNKTNQLINLFVFFNLMRKIPEGEISNDFLKKAKAISASKHFKETANYYSIPLYDEDLLTKANERAKTYKNNCGSIDAISREWIIRTFGEELAKEVFPKRDEKLTDKQNEQKIMIESIINTMIKSFGYITLEQILDNMTGNRDNNKVKLKRVLQQILNENGLEKRKARKEDKVKYNIESEGYPVIITKTGGN